jgi:hypothetical protein
MSSFLKNNWKNEKKLSNIILLLFIFFINIK